MKTYLAVTWGTVSEGIQIECRRYMGSQSAVGYNGDEFLYTPPKGILLKPWIESNIARMATFGVKARKVRL